MGQNSLLWVSEELLITFYHNGKKSFDFLHRKSILLNLMNILTILQIIDPLTYTYMAGIVEFCPKTMLTFPFTNIVTLKPLD